MTSIGVVGKPEATKMFDIDATIVALIQQAKPNDGTLAAIGKLGIEGSDNYAFDIAATPELVNTAYRVSGTSLHTVDLEAGAATSPSCGNAGRRVGGGPAFSMPAR